MAICALLCMWCLATNIIATDHAFQNITFTGNTYFTTSKIWELIEHQDDETFDIDQIDLLCKKVLDLYLSRGFLFASVQITPPEDTERPFTRPIIQITEGSIVRAENIIYAGNHTTRESILWAESRIQKGQIVTLQNIETAQRRIATKPYIESCHIVPVNENTILINVIEGKMTNISGIIGYANKNNDSANAKNNFTGQINASFLNLLGTDRNLGIVWKSLANDFTSVMLNYHESGHSSINIAADIMLYRETQDSTYAQTEIGTDIYYQLPTQKIGTTIGRKDLFPGARETDKPLRQSDTNIGFFWTGNFTDDDMNPTKGWETEFRQNIYFVKRHTETDTNIDFSRMLTEMSIANYQKITENIVVANKVSSKFLENKNLTKYDLIKIGGTYTLRGFFENIYAGDKILYTNTEFRYHLTKTSRVFIFTDYGYIEDNLNENRFTDLLGMGLGLRVDTQIGILRMDYGFGHQNKKWTHPMNGIIHFGIETKF